MAGDPRVGELLSRWEAARESGTDLSAEELCLDHPDLSEVIRANIERLRREAEDSDSSQLTTNDVRGERGTGLTTAELPALGGTSNVPSDGELGRIGKYQLRSRVGRGGMGAVYAAWDPDLLRTVAVKVIKQEHADNPGARERFLREARAAAGLKSDHIVTVHDAGEDSGTVYLVMELLDGESLDHWLRARSGPADGPTLERVARQVLQGLAAAHDRGLIHRDIKPANLWVEAGTGRIKILDFGLTRSREDDGGLTGEGRVVGTPAYMAPEQAAGKAVDARADLFSTGVVLYQMASGGNPFRRDSTYATLSALATHDAVPARELPGMRPDVGRLIDRLMAKDPDARPRDARAALDEWPPAAGTDTPAARPEGSAARTGLGRGRPLLLAAVGLALLAALVVTAVRWPRQPQQAAPPAAEPPVEIVEFNVYHFARVEGGKAVEARGVFGQTTFGAARGDQLTLEVVLSRPAYAYLLAFPPVGEAELCFPPSEDESPPKADRPKYPSRPEDRNLRYGLSEGAGLWAFSAVVSDQPLRPYRQWLADHPSLKSVRPRGSPGIVLMDDGTEFLALGSFGLRRGTRGKGETAVGQESFESVTNALLAAAPGAQVKSVGVFAVERK